ncbi:hypothetical protein [Virgibacillus profundi]|nr:hypothetical protein [Virgibacillus profundi]
MKNNNNKTPELDTFTLLNPDFHIMEEQYPQEFKNAKLEKTDKSSENVE